MSKPTEEAVHFIGRVAEGPAKQAQYAWPGTGFVVVFRGTGIAVRLRDNENEHQPVLDGHPLPKIVTKQGVERYTIADHIPNGQHRLEFYRRTEALFGVTGFLGIDVQAGQIVESERLVQRRIELIGDSISCGYGNEGTSPSCPFSAATENHYLSYGALIARALNAELSTVAWSGRGVVRNYAGETGSTMPELYERTLPLHAASVWPAKVTYDAVIINLGTNDYSTSPHPKESTFVAAYVALLEHVRRNSPGAFILCTVGPLLSGRDRKRAEAAIASAVGTRKAAGDPRVLFHSMKTQNEAPGCDYHPGIATHQRMAEELAQPLRTALGW